MKALDGCGQILDVDLATKPSKTLVLLPEGISKWEIEDDLARILFHLDALRVENPQEPLDLNLLTTYDSS